MEEEKEKLEFLKREEIRTMQKDIAKLREIEAQKERERIAILKTEEKIQAPSLEKVPEKKEEVPVGLIQKISKKPSSFQKILIRAL